MPVSILPSVGPIEEKAAACAGCPPSTLKWEIKEDNKVNAIDEPTKPTKRPPPAQNQDQPKAEPERYRPPKPPRDGKIIALDCHPDIFAAGVFTGSAPHDMRRLSVRDNLSLEALLAWVAGEFTSKDLFLMEAGSNSFEICRRLVALGLRAVVLESAHVGRQAKRYADNDRMATERIARVFLAGDAPAVWVPDLQSCERRELLHAYQRAVTDQVAASNSLKSYLNQFAIRLGKRSLKQARTREWILQKREWSPLQRELVLRYLAELDHQSERRKEFLGLIERQVCAEPLMLRCLKLLGIGMINAFALLAIIGDVQRFERPEKLVAYIGLNPGRLTSGLGKNVKLGVGKRGRGDLRNLLVQGAQAVLRTGRHTALGKWGWKLFARKGNRNVAVAAVARKLTVQIWHLLRGNAPVDLESDKSFCDKLKKLAVSLGKKGREQIGLPSPTRDAVAVLLSRIGAPPKTQP